MDGMTINHIVSIDHGSRVHSYKMLVQDTWLVKVQRTSEI